MLALSLADYSFVQPASSIAYGVVALLGYLMLGGQSLSTCCWLGIAVICLGVFIVGALIHEPRRESEITALRSVRVDRCRGDGRRTMCLPRYEDYRGGVEFSSG